MARGESSATKKTTADCYCTATLTTAKGEIKTQWASQLAKDSLAPDWSAIGSEDDQVTL